MDGTFLCHGGQTKFALTALIQLTFLENYLTFLEGPKTMHHVHNFFVSLTKKKQENSYTKASTTEATQSWTDLTYPIQYDFYRDIPMIASANDLLPTTKIYLYLKSKFCVQGHCKHRK